jgi:hypothetical protein
MIDENSQAEITERDREAAHRAMEDIDRRRCEAVGYHHWLCNLVANARAEGREECRAKLARVIAEHDQAVRLLSQLQWAPMGDGSHLCHGCGVRHNAPRGGVHARFCPVAKYLSRIEDQRTPGKDTP